MWRNARFKFNSICSSTVYVWTHKGTEGEKSASGSEENSDSDDDLEISHGSDANEFDEDEETEHVSHW